MFRTGLYSNKRGERRGKTKQGEKKKKKRKLGKQEERKNIASRGERSETNCSFIGKAEADVEGERTGKRKSFG